MKKTILTIGASNSTKSINKRLAHFASQQVNNAIINLVDLNDFEMPIYSEERQAEAIPSKAIDFKQYIKEADGIIISFAEHNGTYTSAFKNIMDWVSVIEQDLWASKPMFLLATSPGPRGAITALEIALAKFKIINSAQIVGFSLPSFFDNFNEESGINNEDLLFNFEQVLKEFEKAL